MKTDTRLLLLQLASNVYTHQWPYQQAFYTDNILDRIVCFA